MEKPVIQWHRLFGIILQDFFADSPYEVELEKDLSIKQQLLDVLIIRKREGEFTGVLPDGMDDLRLHNLLTFKSFQQSLDSWAVEELLGHFVSYRKQVFPRGTPMPAVEEIGLYAVCARRPEKLMEEMHTEAIQPGVYKVRIGRLWVRVLVTRELPDADQNVVLELFSGVENKVRFAARRFIPRSSDLSATLNALFETYSLKGIHMPYTIEDFRREYMKHYLHELPPKERLEGLSPKERLEGLSPEEIRRWLEQLEKRNDASPDEPGE